MGAILKCSVLSVLVLALTAPDASAQVTVEHQDFNASIGWSETSYDGNNNDAQTADWSVESSGSNPSCSPHEGSRMARFNSYYADTGDESRIRSDSRDLTGAEVAEARFWMYRDGGDSGHNDFVRFQLSTDGGDSYFTMRLFYRYTAGAAGWEEKVIPLGYYTTESNVRFALRAECRGGNNIFVDDLLVTKATLPAGAEGKACATGGECDSGTCGVDPFGAGRCRDAGTACIGANREPVAAGETVCAGPDLATCAGTDNWNTTDCYDDCGAYLDVHQCEHNGSAFFCAGCVEECIDLFGISEGCDPDAWCDFNLFWSECIRKVADGTACGANKECLSDNCVASPGGQKYCAPAGTECVDGAGQPVSIGQAICVGGDRYECQAVGWAYQDCYTNCGFYNDVDSCTAGACDTCADSCNGDQDCKPNIICTGGECVGGLDLGSTCQVDSQCDSDHCIDGRCCQDICSAPCHRCDVDASGVCRAIPAGQDPDGECPGQGGACQGSCNGLGGCAFPEGAICDLCARCDGAGRCLSFVTAGTDPADECPTCQVCSGSQAACVPAQAGEDPVGDCTEGAPEACGLDGTCDGAGTCRFWPQGTACGNSTCSGDVEQRADACDGAGQCVDGGTASCAPFRCADAERCATDCAAHSACMPDAFCASGGVCLPDLGEGADCAGVVYPGLLDDAACLNGYCFDDDFDGQGAFCTLNPNGCVHDGEVFPSGYALCEGDDWFKVCEGGVPGWSEQVGCQAGTCDAGGGAGTGIRASGSCTSGPGGGCSSACTACEPYMAQDGSTCLDACAGDSDCWPSYTCSDGECVVPEGLGDPCESQGDCQGGWVCIDGRCCEHSCTGPCRACNLPGRFGLCTNVEADVDPDGDCDPEPAESCGTTGVCDGQGACQLWPADQVCAQEHCQGGLFVSEAVCDGAGHCVPAAQEDCRPGLCVGGGCTGDCVVHADCDPSGFCGQAGECLSDLADGESCQDVVFGGLDADPACSGGYCYPDSWNESGAYCAGAVDVCVADGQTYAPGYRLCAQDPWFRVCLGGEAGWGPAVDCAAAGVCDAGGGPGSGVVPDEECLSGPEGGCAADCESCYPYRASSPGQCAGTCAEDADCWPGHACVGGACEPDVGLGQACADEADCDGFACVDGVCCNLACDATCLVCNDPIALGVCLPAEAGTDPAAECDEETGCGQTGQCDGVGACAFRPAGRVCEPGTCSDGVRTSPGLCDGRGVCDPGLQHDCPSGLCAGDVCAPQTQTDGGQDADGGSADGDSPSATLRAEAGPIQVVRPGTPVVLDGSASTGPDGASLTFLWTQTSGPTQVELSGSTTARPGFTAQLEGVYGFSLVVGDGQAESPPDFTEVHVQSNAGGCGCGGGPAGGLLGWLLLAWFALARRRDR